MFTSILYTPLACLYSHVPVSLPYTCYPFFFISLFFYITLALLRHTSYYYKYIFISFNPLITDIHILCAQFKITKYTTLPNVHHLFVLKHSMLDDTLFRAVITFSALPLHHLWDISRFSSYRKENFFPINWKHYYDSFNFRGSQSKVVLNHQSTSQSFILSHSFCTSADTSLWHTSAKPNLRNKRRSDTFLAGVGPERFHAKCSTVSSGE